MSFVQTYVQAKQLEKEKKLVITAGTHNSTCFLVVMKTVNYRTNVTKHQIFILKLVTAMMWAIFTVGPLALSFPGTFRSQTKTLICLFMHTVHHI
jgi:hypothetical protein